MLRKFLDFQLSLAEKGKPLEKMRPLFGALDTFCFEPLINRTKRPFIQDAVDLKRWMVLVVIALIPCILMAIWNSGVQGLVYSSSDAKLFNEYMEASKSFSGYFSFTFSNWRWASILAYGAYAFLPIMLISYLAGGLVEGFFASVRGHEISEGFLVSGMLYALIIPASIPYWVAAVGIIVGILLAKELFGGTGMNILNPAMTARAILFFTFPGNMTGDVWIGTNSHEVVYSLNKINEQDQLGDIDGYTSTTALQGVNTAGPEIKRIHVAAIAANSFGKEVKLQPVIDQYFKKWKEEAKSDATFGKMDIATLQAFLTAPKEKGGLGLLPSSMATAFEATDSLYGTRRYTLGNLFWGNIPGSMGETSKIGILIGALFMLIVGVAAWQTMAGYIVGAVVTSGLFCIVTIYFGEEMGAWNPAKYTLMPYRHLLMGSMAFGLVFMATDPVSSTQLSSSKWIYGILIGLVTVMIRTVNPAYPEGVMLAVLFGNVFGPLIDHIGLRHYRRLT
jgi:Na+-transporting NADH:ubiquinone oxidoreductase subunit B